MSYRGNRATTSAFYDMRERIERRRKAEEEKRRAERERYPWLK